MFELGDKISADFTFRPLRSDQGAVVYITESEHACQDSCPPLILLFTLPTSIDTEVWGDNMYHSCKTAGLTKQMHEDNFYILFYREGVCPFLRYMNIYDIV